jgi:hypothetical protein
LFIPDPDFLPIPDLGSRGQKGTESRIQIRNTAAAALDLVNPDPLTDIVLKPDQDPGFTHPDLNWIHMQTLFYKYLEKPTIERNFAAKNLKLHIFLDRLKERSGSKRSLQLFKELFKREIYLLFLFWTIWTLWIRI